FLARRWMSLTTAVVAISMPRLRSIGFIPAATSLRPSFIIEAVSTVAVVVPSPAMSLVFEATWRTIWAPIFSNLSSSSISLATVTPSLVMRPGLPNILRVIACRMGSNNNFGETYRNRSVGNATFPPFVLLNAQNVSLDVETLIHEMIHAALPAARAKEHDAEDFSVFFQSGRTTQGATSHSTLKPDRAAALSNAFFAI